MAETKIFPNIHREFADNFSKNWRRSTKLKRFLDLGFHIGKVASSVNGRSLINVTMSTVSVIRLLKSSLSHGRPSTYQTNALTTLS